MGKEEAPEPVEKGGNDSSTKLSKILSSEIDRQAEDWESENRKISSETSDANLKEYFSDPLVTTDPLTLPGNRDETHEAYCKTLEKSPERFAEREIPMTGYSQCDTDNIIETDVRYLDELISDVKLTSNDTTDQATISESNEFEIPSDSVPPEKSLSVSMEHISNDISDNQESEFSPLFHQDINIQLIKPIGGERSYDLLTLSSNRDNVNKVFDIVNNDSFNNDDETVPSRQDVDIGGEDTLLNINQSIIDSCLEINCSKIENQDTNNDNLNDSRSQEDKTDEGNTTVECEIYLPDISTNPNEELPEEFESVEDYVNSNVNNSRPIFENNDQNKGLDSASKGEPSCLLSADSNVDKTEKESSDLECGEASATFDDKNDLCHSSNIHIPQNINDPLICETGKTDQSSDVLGAETNHGDEDLLNILPEDRTDDHLILTTSGVPSEGLEFEQNRSNSDIQLISTSENLDNTADEQPDKINSDIVNTDSNPNPLEDISARLEEPSDEVQIDNDKLVAQRTGNLPVDECKEKACIEAIYIDDQVMIKCDEVLINDEVSEKEVDNDTIKMLDKSTRELNAGRVIDLCSEANILPDLDETQYQDSGDATMLSSNSDEAVCQDSSSVTIIPSNSDETVCQGSSHATVFSSNSDEAVCQDSTIIPSNSDETVCQGSSHATMFSSNSDEAVCQDSTIIPSNSDEAVCQDSSCVTKIPSNSDKTAFQDSSHVTILSSNSDEATGQDSTHVTTVFSDSDDAKFQDSSHVTMPSSNSSEAVFQDPSFVITVSSNSDEAPIQDSCDATMLSSDSDEVVFQDSICLATYSSNSSLIADQSDQEVNLPQIDKEPSTKDTASGPTSVSSAEDVFTPSSDGENDNDKNISLEISPFEENCSLKSLSKDMSTDKSEHKFSHSKVDNFDLSLIKIEEMNLDERIRWDSYDVVKRKKPDIYPNLLKSILRVNKNNGDKRTKLNKIEKIAEKLSAESGRLKSLAPKLEESLSSSEISAYSKLRPIAPKPIQESSSKSESPVLNSAEVLALALGTTDDIPKITSAVEILRVDSPDAVRKKPDLTPSVSLIPTEITKKSYRNSNFSFVSLNQKTTVTSSVTQQSKSQSGKELSIPPQFFNLSGVNIELRNVLAEGSSKSSNISDNSTSHIQQLSRLSPPNIPPSCLSNPIAIPSFPLSPQANFPPNSSHTLGPIPLLPNPNVPLQRFCSSLNVPVHFNQPSTIPQIIPRPHMKRSPVEHVMPHHKFIEAFYRTKSGVIKKKFVKVPFIPYNTKANQVFSDGTSQISMVDPLSQSSPFLGEQSEMGKQHVQPFNLSNSDMIYPNSPIIPQPVLSLMKQTEKGQTEKGQPDGVSRMQATGKSSSSNLEMIPIMPKDVTKLDTAKSRNSSDNRQNGAVEVRLTDEVPKRVLDALLHDNKTETCKTDVIKTDKSVTKSQSNVEVNPSLVSATSSLLKLSKGTPTGCEEVVFNSNDLKVILVQPESELHSSKKGSLLPLYENAEKQQQNINSESEEWKNVEDQNIIHEGNPEKITRKKKRGSLESVCEKLSLKNITLDSPVQIREISESIAPSKSPDIVLLPKSVADKNKSIDNTDNSADRCAQILKVPKFNVADESKNIIESDQFISLFSLGQRSIEKSLPSSSSSLINPISDDSQMNNGSIPKSSSPTNVPEHGGRRGMVSRKSTGRRKASDPTDTVKKSRGSNSEAQIQPLHTSDVAPSIEGKKIILSDVTKGCGGEVNVVEVLSNESVSNGSASGQQEQQDAIYRLRMLGTDVSLEDQKVTKNLRGGDTVLVTPVEDGEYQPPAIKLLEDMAKSTELPVASPVLTALGQQSIKSKRKSQQNNPELSKLPSAKESSTKVQPEIQNSSSKQTRSKSEISNLPAKVSVNGENNANIKNDNDDVSNDSHHKLPDCKVSSISQSNDDDTVQNSDIKVQQNNQIVTRSSIQQQNMSKNASNNLKIVENDKKDLPSLTDQASSPSSDKVQKISTSPHNQKVTRSSVQQQNLSQNVLDDKTKSKNEESVQNSLPQSNNKVPNQSVQKVTRSSIQNALQLQIVVVENDINNTISKVMEHNKDSSHVSEVSQKNCENLTRENSDDKNNELKCSDGIFLIRPQHYVKTVDGEQVWSCDICTVVCSQLPLFRKHYLRLHISPKFISEKDKEALNITEGDSDKDCKKIFKCHVCKDYFDKKIDLKLHLQNHPKRSDDSQTNKLLKQYVCPHCDAIFKWRKPFGKHKKLCQENIKNYSKPSHHCLYCNETFFTPYRKKNHILSCHPYTRKKHPCVFCNKIFQSNIILFNHLVNSHSSAFFGCMTCKERYMNLAELKAHFKKSHPTESLKVKNSSTNLSDKDFHQCSKCERVFLIENCLNKHECSKIVEKDSKEKIVRKVQKRIKPLTVEQRIENSGGPSGETEFYSRVSTNIRENLTYHLDGKLHPVEAPSNSVSSHRTILNFNAAVQSTTVPVQPPLQDKQIRSPSTPTYEKFNFPKEYDGRCGLTSFIKDASYLDISTQLIMRRNLQRLNLLPQTSPDPRWDVPASLALERLGAQCAESFGIADPPQVEENGNEEPGNSTPLGELSGEWVRERTYVCSTCLWQSPCLWSMEDHKYSAHPHVWCPQHELNTPNHKHIASFAYRRLVVFPKEEKRERACRKEKYECSKCRTGDIKTKQDLHRHILECVGEDLAALELLHNAAVVRIPTGKRRSKWRGGSRRTRQGLKRNIPSTPPAQNSKRNKKLLRTKPGDADTIEKMIANLPAKRATRRVLGFDEIDIKTRSQATIQNSSAAPTTSQATKKTLKPSASQTSPPKKKIQGIDTSAENGNVLSSLRMMPVKKLDMPEMTDSMPTLEIEGDIGLESSTTNTEIPVLTPATAVSNQIITPATGIPLSTPVLPPSTTAILLLVPPLHQQPPPLVPILNKDVKSKISEPNQICNISIIQAKVKVETLSAIPESQDNALSKQILNTSSPFPKANCKKLVVPPSELKNKKRGRPMGSKNKSKLNRVKKDELKKTAGTKKLRGWWLKEHSKDLKHTSSHKLKGWWLKELTQKAKSTENEKMKDENKKDKKVDKKKDLPKEEVISSKKEDVKEKPIETPDNVVTSSKPKLMLTNLEKIIQDVATGVINTKNSPKKEGLKRRKRKSDPEEDKLKQDKLKQEKKRKQEVKKTKEEEKLKKPAEKKKLLGKKKQQRDEAKKLKEDKLKIDEAKKMEDEKKNKAEEEKKKKQSEEEKQKEDEITMKEEEERKRLEQEAMEKKAKEEEKKRKEEESRKRKEEDMKKKEEEKRKKEEETKKRKEEEAKKKEEEKKRKEEEAKKKEEDKKRKEEEAKKKEEEKKRKEEEVKKRKEEEKKRKEEEAKKRKEEETRRKEEEKKRKEEISKKAEEDKKRKEEEERVKAELENQKKEDERRRIEEKEIKQKQDEEKKLKEDKERKIKEEEERKLKNDREPNQMKPKELKELYQAESETKNRKELEENSKTDDKRKKLDIEEAKILEEVIHCGFGKHPASGGSSPLTGDESKFSDTDSQKNLKLKKRKKHLDMKMKKRNRLSLAQKIRRKRLMMKMKESEASCTGKEVVSSGMKWEVEVRPEPELQAVVSTSESTPLPEEMDWLSGVTPPPTSVVKLVPTSTLLMDQMTGQNLNRQHGAQTTVDSVPVAPSSSQSANGNAIDPFWRDSSFQTSTTPNLGSILDSVNTLLNEPDLTSYTPLMQTTISPPQYSLADLQKAMGASDAEMAVLQQLGEMKVEENKEEDWNEINIIDLDKQSTPVASSTDSTQVISPASRASDSSASSAVSSSSSSSSSSNSNASSSIININWLSKPSTSLPATTSQADTTATTLTNKPQLRGNTEQKPNCAVSPRTKDGSSDLFALHPGKEVVCPTCQCHFMGFPALQLHISKYHPPRPVSSPLTALETKLASVRRMSSNICHKQDLTTLNKRALLESAKGSRMICFMCQQILPSNLMSSHLVVEHSAKPVDITKCRHIGDHISGGSTEIIDDGGEKLKSKMSSALGDLLDRAVNNLLSAKQDSSNRMSGGAIQLLNKLCALRKREGSHHRLHPSAKDMLLKVYAKNHLKAALKKGIHKGGVKPSNFICGICGETFLWEATWSKHVLDVHTRPCAMPNIDELQSDPDDPEEEDWRMASGDEGCDDGEGGSGVQPTPLVPTCSNCGLGFENMSELLAHRKEIHNPVRRDSIASQSSKTGLNSRASSTGTPSRCSTPAIPSQLSQVPSSGNKSPAAQVSSSKSPSSSSSPDTSGVPPPPPSISPAPCSSDNPPDIIPEAAPSRLTRSSASYFNPPTPPPPILTPEGDLIKTESNESKKKTNTSIPKNPATTSSPTNTSTNSTLRKRSAVTKPSIPSKKEPSREAKAIKTEVKETVRKLPERSSQVSAGSSRNNRSAGSTKNSTVDTDPPKSSSSHQKHTSKTLCSSSSPHSKRGRRRRKDSLSGSTRPKRLTRSNEDESVRKRAEVALRELNLTHKAKQGLNLNNSSTSVRWTSAMTFSPRPKSETNSSPPKSSPPSTAATAIYDFHEDQPP